MNKYEHLAAYLDESRDEVIALQKSLVAIPALGPTNDGQGEWEKADFLIEYLRTLGISDIRELNAPDNRVPRGTRPNIAAILPGKDQSRTLWVIGHMDVVPAGDLSLWETDPFSLEVDGDFVVGRGTEDNHQGIVSSLLVLKGLKEKEITPAVNFGILLVSDEETASKYGLDYVLENHNDLFAPEDLFLVPDFGNPTSDMIEVAEKSMLWLKVSVYGKQCHASTPQEGVNSLVGASDLIVRTMRLHDLFDRKDDLFNPPHSTFEPTKKDKNVPNINTIPGLDVFYVDCRVLPGYSVDDILEAYRTLAGETENLFGVRVETEVVQREEASSPTPVESEIVSRLHAGIKQVYGVEGKPMGIGGGTVAAFLRRKGYQAAVWSTLIHNAHQPNERSSIPKTLGDAKVMAHMVLQ